MSFQEVTLEAAPANQRYVCAKFLLVYPVLVDTLEEVVYSTNNNGEPVHRIMGMSFWNDYQLESLIANINLTYSMGGSDHHKWFLSQVVSNLIALK